MMFAVINLSVAAALFLAMLALQKVGRRLGERDRGRGPTGDKVEAGQGAGTVFALLGLLVAFTFSGAGARYESRRHLIAEEANAIGTAWLRLDLLPAPAQPHLRDLFRRYVDARLERNRPSS